MAEKCKISVETENELLDVVLNLAKDNSDVPVVKDILTCKQDDIKVTLLKQTCSHIIFQVKLGHQQFVVKKLNRSKDDDAQAKKSLSVEAKGFIWRQQLYPALTPLMYCWSDKQNCLALEDLSSFKSLRSELVSGEIDKSTILRIADAVAQMHRASHVNNCEPDRFKDLTQEFQDSPSIHSLADVLKVNPDNLADGELKNAVVRLLANDRIKSTVASLVESAKNKKQALLHGRLNGESILVSGEHVKVTSGQYLFVGPCGFDVGQLLAQYLSSYHEHMLTEENNDWHRKISYLMIDTAKDTVERYLAVMRDHLKDQLEDFISDVAAFCGLELVNRALKSTESPSKSVEIIGSGERLLNAHQRIHTADRLVVIALMLTY